MENAMQDEEKRFVGDGFISRRYHITPQTLWRWRNNPELNFPQPIKIGGPTATNRTDLADLDAFDERQKRGAK
jgi:hypothetical protein